MTGNEKSGNGEKLTQKNMDQTLEDTFPASDPPSWSSPHPGRDLKLKKQESKGRPDEVHKQEFSRKDYLAGHKEQSDPSAAHRNA